MFKKILFLVYFLAVFAVSAKAEELTPRQLLLLQVPESYELTSGNVTWSVKHETEIGPVEIITINDPSEIIIYSTIGPKPIGLASFTATMLGSYALFANGKFDESGSLHVLNRYLPPETERDIGRAITKKVTEILEAFDVLTDEDLATFIKSQNFGKKATPL